MASKETKLDPIERDRVVQIMLASTGVGHVLLYGPPGTGKTHDGMRLARMLEQEHVEMTLKGDGNDFTVYLRQDITSDEHGNPKSVYREGPLLDAYRNGKIAVLNEIGNAGSDLLDRLFMILDHFSLSEDTLPTGEVVRAHPKFRVIATMNGVPDQLPEPIKDRFAIKIRISQPSTEQLDRLDADVREVVVAKYANCDPMRGPDVTYRNGLFFCQLRQALGEDRTAAGAVFGDADKTTNFMESLEGVKLRMREEIKLTVQRTITGVVRLFELQQRTEASKRMIAAVQRLGKLQLDAEIERLMALAAKK